MSAHAKADTGPTRTPDAPEPKKTLWERIPRRIFRGRVRTTTAALVLLFIAALVLYGQRSDHYNNLDEANRQNEISRVQQPRTTTPEPTEEVIPETTPSTTTPSTTTESTDSPSVGEEPSSSSSEVPSTTTTPPGRGGFQLPELPTPSIAP